MDNKKIKDFQKSVWSFYAKNKRNLPWRNTHDPYKIWISEIMLQQTQVKRVLEKYKEFLDVFPNLETLRASSPEKLLSVWKGLGYNNRGLRLIAGAKHITEFHKGRFPKTEIDLMKIPGVGNWTAGAIRIFAFELVSIPIDTNIRTVFIKHFFPDEENIPDQKITELLTQTLPEPQKIRDWYYALLDLGSSIKLETRIYNTKTKHYSKQTPFKGSNRQKRAQILAILLKSKATEKMLSKKLSIPLDTLQTLLEKLQKEGWISRKNGSVLIKK